MKEFALLLLEYVLALAIPVVSGFVVKWIKEKAQREKTNSDKDTLYECIEIVEQIVVQAVTHTSQVFVDSLKSKGVFTKDKQIEAFNKAKDEVLTLVPVSALKILNEYFGDFDSWLDSKIEQAVYTLKN